MRANIYIAPNVKKKEPIKQKMIKVDTQIQAGQNVFGYIANIDGDEICVLKKLPDGVTSKQIDVLAQEALTKIKTQLFKNEKLPESTKGIK